MDFTACQTTYLALNYYQTEGGCWKVPRRYQTTQPSGSSKKLVTRVEHTVVAPSSPKQILVVIYLLMLVRRSTKDDKFSTSSDLCFTYFLASKSHDEVHLTIHENQVCFSIWCVLIRNCCSILDPGLKYAEYENHEPRRAWFHGVVLSHLLMAHG